jgi:hypothetical protein
MPVNWYSSYEAALRRVEVLKASGIWPGIVGPLENGGWRLTFNPDLHEDRGARYA